ncbi:MAG TPA: hypothetical protein VGR84_13805 [Candidatus Acidoferrales bacterium]|nr:hypothetical protein [Candidatus Acidoferrales bacterium]
MPGTEFPQWLDNVDTNTIGVFTLDDGERLTADVLDFNDKRAELNVEVISSNRSSPHTRERRAISVDRVISFEPRPRAAQPWPYSDPCRSMPFSGPRFALMTTLFLTMIIGGMLFALLPNWPYAIQAASAIIYTIFVVFFTFARTGSRGGKDVPPYMFTCPAVRPQVYRLVWRHFVFLCFLFMLQTLALALHPKLSDWWDTLDSKGTTPFEIALPLLCLALAYTQVFTNRSLLKRAHRDFST